MILNLIFRDLGGFDKISSSPGRGIHTFCLVRWAFSYQLIHHKDSKELQKIIKKMIKEGKEIIPMLMFLYKEG